MRNIFSLVILFFVFASCTTVKLHIVENKDETLTMTSTEESCLKDPKEKMRVIFSPEQGGKIHSISWEGKVVVNNFSESYPNLENDFKKLNNRILNDESGLILVDAKMNESYQLRRSYSLVYDEEENNHYLEVIYNVKNLGEAIPLKQQWVQNFSLLISDKLRVSNSQLEGNFQGKKIRILSISPLEIKITNEINGVTIGHEKATELPHKERLSWKVLYIIED